MKILFIVVACLVFGFLRGWAAAFDAFHDPIEGP